MTEFSAFRASPSIPTEEAEPTVLVSEEIDWKAEWEAMCDARIKDRERSQEIINERDRWIVDLIRERDAAILKAAAAGDEPNKPNNPGEA